MLIADPARFDGVTDIGVDEHAWRHTRKGDEFVTVIIDLTPVRDGTGPARLLDMVDGRSNQVFKSWLAERDETWRSRVDVVAMDGFTGFKTVAVEELKDDVVVVMDPFHTVRLAGQSLEECRVELDTTGHRGRTPRKRIRAGPGRVVPGRMAPRLPQAHSRSKLLRFPIGLSLVASYSFFAPGRAFASRSSSVSSRLMPVK